MLLRLWLRLERGFLYYTTRLFRIRDNVERVARGFALGMIVNFFPTFGFGVVISGFIARMLGGNLLAGFVGGATLTFFWPFLFYLNMLAGGWVYGRFPIKDTEEVTEAAIRALVWGKTFTAGALLNSAVVGLLLYGLLYWVFSRYRARGLARLHRAMKRHQRKVAEHKASGV
ncbi:MAG: DUF2062 domain-containing protein [Verrucomicrobia bacterium]|nr:DUF2062 domain-containing protein [Verrucomicrobiota bacterium]